MGAAGASEGMESGQGPGRALVGREQQGSLFLRPGRTRSGPQKLERLTHRPPQGPSGRFPEIQEEVALAGCLPVHYRPDQGAGRPQARPASQDRGAQNPRVDPQARPPPGAGQCPRSLRTSSRTADRWFISFTVEVQRHLPGGNGKTTVVGVDVGVRQLAVLSNGTTIANPRALEDALRKLRRLNRQLARREPGSGRRKKTHRRLARVHARTANIRCDALHKLTSSLATEYGTVVVEHLNVGGMIRNRRLARAISDTGLAEIRRQLIYKTTWYGGRLVVADRFYPSSKTCSGLGWGESQAHPGRAHLHLRGLWSTPGQGYERRPQPRQARTTRRPEWLGDAKRPWSRPLDPACWAGGHEAGTQQCRHKMGSRASLRGRDMIG